MYNFKVVKRKSVKYYFLCKIAKMEMVQKNLPGLQVLAGLRMFLKFTYSYFISTIFLVSKYPRPEPVEGLASRL